MSIFNKNQKRRVNKNKFDLSHEVKMTHTWRDIRPFYMQEVIPGDSFRVKSEVFARTMPLVFPTMHRVDVKTEYYYVPYFQIWDEWKDFIRGGDSGEDYPNLPTFEVNNTNKGNFAKGTLADYLGLPPTPSSGTVLATDINALPFKAYHHIMNNWYRDQDLETETPINRSTSGSQSPGTMTATFKRAYAKDYFTSARPTAQKGQPVNFLSNTVERFDGTNASSGDIKTSISGGLSKVYDFGSQQIRFADTIQNLRQAEAMQSYMERLQRSGNRYREYLSSIWGQTADNMEIDVPYYLGGGKQPIAISEVLQNAQNQTSGTSDGEGVGDLFGHGISVGDNHGFRQSFKYHGLIIGVISVVPKASYSLGIDRVWTRQDRFDHYQPDFALIGEQPLYRKEVYFNWTSGDGDDEWGYQQRYAEYKYGKSRVLGEMRDPTFRNWHLDRDFSILTPATVNLNKNFIEVDESFNELDRIFQVTTGDKFILQIFNKVDAVRPMPYEAIPDLT